MKFLHQIWKIISVLFYILDKLFLILLMRVNILDTKIHKHIHDRLFSFQHINSFKIKNLFSHSLSLYFIWMKMNTLVTRFDNTSSCNHMPPWRNRLARSAVNRKVGGSSPPGGAHFLCQLSFDIVFWQKKVWPWQDSNLQSPDS